MRKVLMIIFCIAFFSACGPIATVKGYEMLLDSWLGSTEDHLVERWGVPQNVYENNGKRYLTYQESRSYTAPVSYNTYYNNLTNQVTTYQTGGGTTYFNCTTTFTIENGKITYWKFNGNDCRSTYRVQ